MVIFIWFWKGPWTDGAFRFAPWPNYRKFGFFRRKTFIDIDFLTTLKILYCHGHSRGHSPYYNNTGVIIYCIFVIDKRFWRLQSVIERASPYKFCCADRYFFACIRCILADLSYLLWTLATQHNTSINETFEKSIRFDFIVPYAVY